MFRDKLRQRLWKNVWYQGLYRSIYWAGMVIYLLCGLLQHYINVKTQRSIISF